MIRWCKNDDLPSSISVSKLRNLVSNDFCMLNASVCIGCPGGLNVKAFENTRRIISAKSSGVSNDPDLSSR